MATGNVEFYEKLKHLQEQKRESETRRLLLEQQLSMNTSSGNKVHALRVAQLQNYWKKLCEDERRSQRRNEQLLRDLDRISEQAARFAERSEKLRTLKCEYEAYIERTYPNWKEKVMCRRQQRMCANSNEQQSYTESRLAQNEQPVHFLDGSDYHQAISNGRIYGFVQPIVGGSAWIQPPGHDGIDQRHPGAVVFIPSGQTQPATIHPGLNPYPGTNVPAYAYPGQNGPAYAQQNPEAKELIQHSADDHGASTAGNQRKVSLDSPAIGQDARDLADQLRAESIHRSADVQRAAATNQRKVSLDSPAIGLDDRDLADRLRAESIHRSADVQRASATNQRKVSLDSPAIGLDDRDLADRLRAESIHHSADVQRVAATGNQRKVSLDSPAIGLDDRDLADRLRAESIHRSADVQRAAATGNQTKVSLENPVSGHASRNPAASAYHASKDPNVIPIGDVTSKNPTADPANRASKDPIASPAKDPSFNNSAGSSSKHLASRSPIKQSDYQSPASSPEKHKANDVMASRGIKKTDDRAKAVEQKEEIQTDRTYATEISDFDKDFEEDVDQNFNLSNCADPMIIRHEGKSVSVPPPDVSLQGFYRMLKAVEDDVSLGRSPKFYFRSATPRTSVIQEIITNANREVSLSHLNVESIAMVILEQLPCLSMNSKNSCLLTDQILTSCYGEVNNEVVRSRLDPSDHFFWDSLYNHFLVFLQHKVLSVTEIAEMFAPLLVSRNSKLQKQAVALVTKVLEAVSKEELYIASPRSVSDFSLASPRPTKDGASVSRPAAVQSVKSSTGTSDQKPKVSGAAKAPSPSSLSPPLLHSAPLLPGLPLGNSLDDDGLPLSRDPLATLTQTAAYKQLLASTSLSHKLPDMDSDDDDDEIEKNLSQHFSNSRPATANKMSEESVKSPKSPDHLKSPKSPKSDSARSTFSDESLKQEIDRKNSLALKSASLKSGRSAVENIISRVHEDFDLDDEDDDDNPPVPTSSLTKSNNVQLKVLKNDDDDDFWA